MQSGVSSGKTWEVNDGMKGEYGVVDGNMAVTTVM